jgi:hypothetical protein
LAASAPAAAATSTSTSAAPTSAANGGASEPRVAAGICAWVQGNVVSRVVGVHERVHHSVTRHPCGCNIIQAHAVADFMFGIFLEGR